LFSDLSSTSLLSFRVPGNALRMGLFEGTGTVAVIACVLGAKGRCRAARHGGCTSMYCLRDGRNTPDFSSCACAGAGAHLGRGHQDVPAGLRELDQHRV
jgi:hypothetical protein